MEDLSRTFRLRTVQSEQRAHAASDPVAKAEWEELAIQWHLLANAGAQSSDEGGEIDFA